MTDDPLATLERLLKEVGPELWVVSDESCAQCIKDGTGEWDIYEIPGGYHNKFGSKPHAELIALLRNLAPALVEEVRTSRARVRALTEQQFKLMKQVEAGTFHSGHCSASRESMVGSDGCCCVHGEPYRRIRALEEALRKVNDHIKMSFIERRGEALSWGSARDLIPTIDAALEENRRG